MALTEKQSREHHEMLNSVPYVCKAIYGTGTKYKEFLKATSHLSALSLFRDYVQKLKCDNPDRIEITNLKTRVRITIDDDNYNYTEAGNRWDVADLF